MSNWPVWLTVAMLVTGVTILIIILWVIVEKWLLDKKTLDETKDDLFERWQPMTKNPIESKVLNELRRDRFKVIHYGPSVVSDPDHSTYIEDTKTGNAFILTTDEELKALIEALESALLEGDDHAHIGWALNRIPRQPRSDHKSL